MFTTNYNFIIMPLHIPTLALSVLTKNLNDILKIPFNMEMDPYKLLSICMFKGTIAIMILLVHYTHLHVSSI